MPVFSLSIKATKKVRQCSSCKAQINIGESCTRYTTMREGKFVYHYHCHICGS